MTNLLFTVLFTVFITALNAQSNIQVEITNLRNEQGAVKLQLLDEKEKEVQSEIGIIKNGHCSITLSGVKNGKYAIRYYHDENANGELDTNFMGIPKEGYGFSNDAYGKYGPKSFNEWIFIVDNQTKMTLKTAYL